MTRYSLRPYEDPIGRKAADRASGPTCCRACALLADDGDAEYVSTSRRLPAPKPPKPSGIFRQYTRTYSSKRPFAFVLCEAQPFCLLFSKFYSLFSLQAVRQANGLPSSLHSHGLSLANKLLFMHPMTCALRNDARSMVLLSHSTSLKENKFRGFRKAWKCVIIVASGQDMTLGSCSIWRLNL